MIEPLDLTILVNMVNAEHINLKMIIVTWTIFQNGKKIHQEKKLEINKQKRLKEKFISNLNSISN